MTRIDRRLMWDDLVACSRPSDSWMACPPPTPIEKRHLSGSDACQLTGASKMRTPLARSPPRSIQDPLRAGNGQRTYCLEEEVWWPTTGHPMKLPYILWIIWLGTPFTSSPIYWLTPLMMRLLPCYLKSFQSLHQLGDTICGSMLWISTQRYPDWPSICCPERS